MARRPALCLVLWLLHLIVPIRAALFDFLDNYDLGAFTTGASAVVGDSLYIDGGAFQSGSKGTFGPENRHTLIVDLKTEWNAGTVRPNHIQGHDHPRRYEKLFFDASSNSLFSFGGYFSNLDWPQHPNPGLEVLDVKQLGAKWSVHHPPAPSSISSTYWGTSAVSPDAFFLLGGLMFGDSFRYSISGIVTYNITTGQWTNSSSSAYAGTRPFDGTAEYIPGFGDNGIIVFIGGSSHKPSKKTYLLDMSDIYVYDIAHEKFYLQEATSASESVPRKRQRPCTVVAKDPKSNSYDIFMFGGYILAEGDENQALGSKFQIDAASVWVLSIPSFQWTQLEDSTSRFPQSISEHSCNLIGNRQLAVIGGTPQLLSSYDPPGWTYGPTIFDMTTMQWLDGYDPNAAPYERAPVLTKNANAKPVPPEWNSKGLARIFPAAKPATSSSPSSGSTNVGAIAGGVVGGIVGLAAILALTWYLVRRRSRRRRSRQQQERHEQSQEQHQSYTDYGQGPGPDGDHMDYYAHEKPNGPAHELETPDHLNELTGSPQPAWELPGSTGHAVMTQTAYTSTAHTSAENTLVDGHPAMRTFPDRPRSGL